jgi:hypothetical protein
MNPAKLVHIDQSREAGDRLRVFRLQASQQNHRSIPRDDGTKIRAKVFFLIDRFIHTYYLPKRNALVFSPWPLLGDFARHDLPDAPG